MAGQAAKRSPGATSATGPRRIITAASLFDGHDAAINLIRRLLQDAGCEVIHLGHDRSVEEIVVAARQEDPHAVAVSSYQGGHMEFFTFLLERLREEGLSHVRVFGGGGGVILPEEAAKLESQGVARIFRPEHGQELGLLGMIQELVDLCDFEPVDLEVPAGGGELALARTLTRLEAGLCASPASSDLPVVVGLTGTGGAGKSSLIDELVLRFRRDFPDRRVAILSADPTRKRTGGALLGDRIRMNAIYDGGVFMRSLATRGGAAISAVLADAVAAVRQSGYDLIILETAGIGQADDPVTRLADLSLYVMTAEYGAPSQLEKIEMLDTADLVVLNKFDRRAGEDALREVRRQVRRLRHSGEGELDEMPVFPTIASQFADPGVDALYLALLERIAARDGRAWDSGLGAFRGAVEPAKHALLPPHREDYLAEVAEAVRGRRKRVEALAAKAQLLQAAARLGEQRHAEMLFQ
ncbi:cobalamin-dependent protein, partial [bacterium]|nr:cobalamin-dependent protein [bacterium]